MGRRSRCSPPQPSPRACGLIDGAITAAAEPPFAARDGNLALVDSLSNHLRRGAGDFASRPFSRNHGDHGPRGTFGVPVASRELPPPGKADWVAVDQFGCRRSTVRGLARLTVGPVPPNRRFSVAGRAGEGLQGR